VVGNHVSKLYHLPRQLMAKFTDGLGSVPVTHELNDLIQKRKLSFIERPFGLFGERVIFHFTKPEEVNLPYL